MAAAAATSDSGYTNRPALHAQAARRICVDGSAGRHSSARTVDRMRLTLRAYEQRQERRAALYSWLAAQAAFSSRS